MRRLRGSVARTALLFLLLAVLLVPPAWGQSAPSPSTVPTTSGHLPPVATLPPVSPAAPARPHPTATLPTFVWGLAFIIYGQGDDTTHFMGEGAAMVVDNNLRNITTFGGEGSGGLTASTVNYNYSVGYFNVINATPSPSARTNVSFADVPGRNFAVLFGGLTDLETQRTANDTWVYYFANQTWLNVTQTVAPPARQSAAFAVNDSGQTALLEGGWNPSYTGNGSTAAVIWNDTWSLNLTTFDWTHLHPLRSPPPMFGSGMIWQNTTHRYDLFGGCALQCSSALWSFGGTPAVWTQNSATGTIPAPRAAGAFVWDGADQVAILVGGFAWGIQGVQAFGDTYLLSMATRTWSTVIAEGGPGPRYDAPNAWADFPGCEGLNILGGDTSLTGPPMNASLLAPFGAPATNCFPNLIAGGGSPPPPPCSVQSVPLELRVTDARTGQGIGSAAVSIHGKCLSTTQFTNAAGFLNYTLPAPDLINFSATAGGYRDTAVLDHFLPNTTNFVTIPMTPDPSLSVRAWGVGVSGVPEPLANVSVQEALFRVLGVTGPTGWLNVSPFAAPPGPLDIGGSLVNYSSASSSVVVPFTGPLRTNLTLLAPGELDVHIVDGTTGRAVAATNEAIRNVDESGPSSIPFVVNSAGWYNVSTLAAANYTVSAGASGYLTNETTFDHPWIRHQVVTLSLPEESGAVLDVLVQNSVTGDRLGGATVHLVGFATVVTSRSGWANFSDVKPPSLYQVMANDTGFTSNYTVVSLTYFQRVDPYYVDLTPLPACTGGNAPCSPGHSGQSGPPFAFVNAGGGVGGLLLATPLALAGAGVVYAVLVARRTTRPLARPTTTATPGR